MIREVIGVLEATGVQDKKKDRRSRNENQAEAGFSRLFINAGSTNGLNPTSLIGLINEQTKERNIDIGRIEIMKNFSFFIIFSFPLIIIFVERNIFKQIPDQ